MFRAVLTSMYVSVLDTGLHSEIRIPLRKILITTDVSPLASFAALP